MDASSDPAYEQVLDFWFGTTDEEGCAPPDRRKRWWKKEASFDAEIRDRFLTEYEALAGGGQRAWLETPRGRLAAIVVLDQFSRNMFRDTPRMYAADEEAASMTLAGIELGQDRLLRGDLRTFFYMPLMHSEELKTQNRCVEVFQAFADELSGDLRRRIEDNVDYAVRHRDIVQKWGRFPHRNAILGRESTPEEQAFLKEPGSSF